MKQVVLFLLTSALAAVAGSAGATCTSITDTSQADFQAGTGSSVDLTTSPGDVLLAATSGSGSLDQQNTTLGSYGEVFSSTQWNAQTFTAGASGPLTRIDLNLYCYLCSATPPVIAVSLRATSGGMPTGADLAPAAALSLSASGVPTWLTATFTTPPTVSSGTQYAIVIRPTTAFAMGTLAFSDSSGGSTGNDSYSRGQLLYSTNSGSAWSVQLIGGVSVDGGFKTYVGSGVSYVASGNLTSSLKDSAPPSGYTPTWTTLSWNASLPASTSVKFQIAASNSSTGTTTFIGPDGTASSYFTSSGASLSQFNGNRYLKYRAYLATSASASTPALNDATVCYSDTPPASADLSITNTDNSSTAVPGGSVTYTIKAANAGPNDVTGASVKDTFPATLSGCQWTCSGASGGTCTSPGTGNINQSVNLPNGGSVTYVATCSVAASATGSLVNTATVSSSVSDPASGNNSATDTDTLTPQADLSIGNSDGVTSATSGSTVTYTIVAANAGPSNVTGATVSDAFPSTLTCTWTCGGAGGGSCPASGSGNISNSLTLPVGGSATYTATCAISAAATGTLTNTASIAAPAGVTDSVTANNTASDSDTLVAPNNVQLTLTDNVDLVHIGQVVVYVIEASNATGTASITVSDTLPAQLTNGSWVCTASGGATCSNASGSGNSLSEGASVPGGGKVDYVYTATVISADKTGMVSNTASVRIQGNAAPTQNIGATDTDTVVIFADGYDELGQTQTLSMASFGSRGGASMTAQLGVDGGLLNKLSVAPVTVATARSADGHELFSLQLMRAGHDILMRSLTPIDGSKFSDVAPWQVVDLGAHRIGFAWSVATHGDNGFLSAGSATRQTLMAAHNRHETPAQLQVATANNIPWLVLVEP
jgi:uncharacterized repeat protein (TIGR01451 family)